MCLAAFLRQSVLFINKHNTFRYVTIVASKYKLSYTLHNFNRLILFRTYIFRLGLFTKYKDKYLALYYSDRWTVQFA